MKTFIAITGLIIVVAYLAYRLFWGSKWMYETFRKNEEKADEASGRMVDLIAFSLLAAGVLCLVIYEILKL